jgi:hypothetical protein
MWDQVLVDFFFSKGQVLFTSVNRPDRFGNSPSRLSVLWVAGGYFSGVLSVLG